MTTPWTGRSRALAVALGAIWVAPSIALPEPLDTPIRGPKLICFKYSTFALNADEQITEFSASPESMSITVKSPSTSLLVGESEIFAPPRTSKTLVATDGNTKVYRVSGGNIRYAIFGPTTFSQGGDRLVIWLSGTGLKGNRADAALFDRFKVRDTTGVTCRQTFTYSWESW